MHRLGKLFLLAAVALAACTGTTDGHKLKVFATGEGGAITGYVYFPGGGRARDLTVVALAPDGSEAGQASTNDEGEFTIPVTGRSDYTVVAETADGHRAEFLVAAEELSAALPARSEPAAVQAESTTAASDEPEADADGMRRLVEEAVRKQVRPLREQLDAYEEKVGFRDVIGGIGYIIGLAGIAFYFLGVRKRDANERER